MSLVGSRSMESFIRGLPKVELHVHVEGTLEPRMMLEFAGRHGIDLPYADEDSIAAAYAFENLQSFLDLYYAGTRVLQTERDFHDLTWAYLSRSSLQNVRHVELFFDPQSHTERGVAFETALNGIKAALVRGQKELGISSGLILCFLRHLPEEAAFEAWEEARPHLDAFVAVGLDSSEVGNPPQNFARVFEKARAEGLRTVAHAGEEGPPSYIREALDLLQVSRIDHGVRILEDPDLTRTVAERKIPLTVCPLSNVRLKVFDTIEHHNLRALMDAGLQVTINSDDPAYFGGYMNENFLATAKALELDRQALLTLSRNAIEASFADDDRKTELREELESYGSFRAPAVSA